MTSNDLKIVLASMPKKRVALLCSLWMSVLVLKPIRMALKPIAIPFLFVSNLTYDTYSKLMSLYGDIMYEHEQKELMKEYDDDENVSADDINERDYV